jgi:GT2 family glycosyltransferase
MNHYRPGGVYAIVVTYNGMQWIDRCLQSLLSSSCAPHVIVIDNHSNDETVAHIKTYYPWVELVLPGKNLGFGQANNIGFKLAIARQAAYVFLLNQDAWVEPGTIEELMHVHASHPEYGILSPIHLNGTGTEQDAYFSVYFSGAVGSQKQVEEEKKHSLKNALPVVSVPFVNAAAWLISVSCLQTTGGFDPVFFHYGEDSNYVQRAAFKGFKTGVVPAVKIFHDRDITGRMQNMSMEKKIQKEWVQLLVYLCDVNNEAYRILFIRRCLRHTLYFITSCLSFNSEKIKFHAGVLRHLIPSAGKIMKSRSAAVTKTGVPFL